MPVGRKRTPQHKNLPPRLYLKRGRYYYGRNQEFAGTNLTDAFRYWAEREATRAGGTPRTFKDLADEYRKRVIPTKAQRTQGDNLDELERLLKVFGTAPLDKVRPAHIAGYLEHREAKVRGNREIALFSAIWNWGRSAGLVDAQNPCTGVRRNKEMGRDRYVTDDELQAVYERACWPVRDALDLHYLTGQRPSDVLKMRLTDVRDGFLWVRQRKTRQPLRLAVEGPLADVLDRIQGRSYKVTSLALVRDENGQPMTYDALFNRFEKAREAAGIHFQLRDLRAKAATDLEDLALAQKLLGHSSRNMTEHYTKKRAGEKVRPLLRTGRGIADKEKPS